MRFLLVGLSLGVAALSLNGCSKHDDDGTAAGGGEAGEKPSSGGAGSAGKSATGGAGGSGATGGDGATGGGAATGGSGGLGGAPDEVACADLSAKLVSCKLSDKPLECERRASSPADSCAYACYVGAECGVLSDYYCNDAENSVATCLAACDTFACGTGRTVPGSAVCDGSNDCSDKSDEKGCVDAPHFDCEDGDSVPGGDRCDGFDDCGDHSDEDGCPALTCPEPTAPEPGVACKKAQDRLKMCGVLPDGVLTGCVDRTQYGACVKDCYADASCDDLSGYFCGSASDGAAISTCTDACEALSDSFPCRKGSDTVQSSWVCDDQSDCDDGSDEADCMFDCATGDMQTTLAHTCDGTSDCSDGSDELGCGPTCSAAPAGG